MTITSLPSHGRIACGRCFSSGAVWGRSQVEEDGWILENNPMAWGSSDPLYLILGFSKGTRQSGVFLSNPFDTIPFAGFRPRLSAALCSLGLLGLDEDIGDRIDAGEPDFAFGSLIRCSVAHTDPKTGRSSKSGQIISALAKRTGGSDWARNCAERFLADLPPRLKLVVLLSNDDNYVAACFERLSAVRPGLRRINAVAYRDDQVVFVHIVHCAATSGSHHTAWLSRDGSVQGRKGRLADEAVAIARGSQNQKEDLVQHQIQSGKAGRSGKRATSPARHFSNPIRDAILASVKADGRLRVHPDRPLGTKYMSIHLTERGRAIAIDTTSRSKQPIWVAAEVLGSSDLPHLDREFYPTGRGRNSNLNVPELKDQDLYRFYPRSAAEAQEIIDLVAGLQSRRSGKTIQ